MNIVEKPSQNTSKLISRAHKKVIHHGPAVFIPEKQGWFSIYKSIHAMYHTNRIKGKKLCGHINRCEKAFNKIYHAFKIKIQLTRYRRNITQHNKDHKQKSHIWHHTQGWKTKFFSKIRYNMGFHSLYLLSILYWNF